MEAKILILTNESSDNDLKKYFQSIRELVKSGKNFPINLDDVWGLAYGRKEEAVRALVSNELFMEGSDYQILRCSAVNVGRPKMEYLLTVKCLEFFIARRVRRVFNVYREFFHKTIDLIENNLPSYQIEDRIKRAERWIEEEKERLYLAQENEKLEKEKDKAIKESNYHKMSSQILDVIANTGESILVRKFAKMINDKVGVKMSQNTLYQFLREHGFVNQDKEPYQKWVDQGLFVVKWKFIKQVGKYKTTTFVTPLGQEYLSKYILDKFSALEDEDTEFEYYEE